MFYVVSLLGGLLFGFGLVISQMVNPAKVLNFLDVAGHWDPTLAMVFIGALGVAMPIYQWALRTRTGPVLAADFEIPSISTITPSLLGGSALFGVGWGLSGFCPGPGLTALPTLLPSVAGFVIALFVGAATYRFLFAR
ncbi:MAG: DUF6691 family protein [Pseudomonadales bacterium]